MASKFITWTLTFAILPVFAYGSCLPGTQIRAGASITFFEQTQASTSASVSYVDPSGNSVEESPAESAVVALESTADTIESDKVTAFVAPDSNAPIYFTNTRSFFQGASLEGKCVKIFGRFCKNDASYYINDGAVLINIDPATGHNIGVPTPVLLRTDLLTSLPKDQDTVIVQGVCLREDDGSLSLLPLYDSAITVVQ